MESYSKQEELVSEQLSNVAENYKFLLDSVTDGVCAFDRDFRYILVNDEVVRMSGFTGWTKENMEGKILMELFPGVEQTEFYKAYSQVMTTREPGTLQTEYEYPDGSIGYFENRIFPTPEGILVIVREITERIVREQEVKKYSEELEFANKELEQFSYIAAHDLASPISNLHGLLNLINLDTEDREENKFLLARIKETADVMDNKIQSLNEIINFKQSLTQELSEIKFKDVYDVIRNNLDARIKKVRVDIHVDFSACDVVHYPKVHLISILQNLIDNALKFLEPQRDAKIDITSEIIGGYSCLIVKDNGCGINMDMYKDKLFTLFKRFNTQVSGRGMGLYMVKSIVERYGGKIEVESKLGEGSLFRIFLSDETT